MRFLLSILFLTSSSSSQDSYNLIKFDFFYNVKLSDDPSYAERPLSLQNYSPIAPSVYRSALLQNNILSIDSHQWWVWCFNYYEQYADEASFLYDLLYRKSQFTLENLYHFKGSILLLDRNDLVDFTQIIIDRMHQLPQMDGQSNL